MAKPVTVLIGLLLAAGLFGASVAHAIEFDDNKAGDNPAKHVKAPEHGMLYDFGYGMGSGLISLILIPYFLLNYGFEGGFKHLVSNHSVSYWTGYVIGVTLLVVANSGLGKAIIKAGNDPTPINTPK